MFPSYDHKIYTFLAIIFSIIEAPDPDSLEMLDLDPPTPVFACYASKIQTVLISCDSLVKLNLLNKFVPSFIFNFSARIFQLQSESSSEPTACERSTCDNHERS
jgi:hypothetical protein